MEGRKAAAERPDVQQFFAKFEESGVIGHERQIAIDEGMALYKVNEEAEAIKNSILRALLILRNESNLPDRLIYPGYTPYASYLKELQIENSRKEQNQ